MGTEFGDDLLSIAISTSSLLDLTESSEMKCFYFTKATEE